MKKIIFLFASTILVLSCNQTTKQDGNKEVQSQQTTLQDTTDKNSTSIGKVNIEDIPYSNADLGVFPFFTLPKNLKELNKPLQKDFDACYFPINGIMTPFEGKLYKTYVTGTENTSFSQHYFEKSLSDYLSSIGAIKVFDGHITHDEYERYHKEDLNKGAEGDIGYADERIQFYVIRFQDNGNVYVQFTSNNASGKLNILQEEALQQTITKVTADDITKDLTEKGKSILYINFDVDRSNVAVDGKEVVSQIAQALEQEPALKIAIEGHTDNTGDATHNKKLSDERANAVMKALVADGIAKSRLSAKGFGAERPLVANDSEDNQAKNRRVELVKVK